MILEQKLDPSTLAIVRAALDDSDRMAVIRDAFLEGKDAQAVQMIRDLDPIGIRKALGVDSGIEIEGSRLAQIMANPQIPFHAISLVVSARCASHFNIEDIRVGNHSQFLNSTAIAADLFTTDDFLHGEVDENGLYTIKISKHAEERLPLRIDAPVCQVGQGLVVVVTNIDRVSHRFYGAFIGQTKTY